MLMEAVVTVNRDQTTGSDVNFNSPGHRSSQDGSFIQDDADMHLILDFDGSGNGRSPTLDQLCRSPYQPSSVLSSSWISRRQNKWATDFDANIAELDFDNVATRDILAIGAATDSYFKNDDDIKDWNENRLASSLRRSLMQASLDLSLSRSTSLFSSTGDVVNKDVDNSTAELLAANLPAFISTDSLDLSSLAMESEHIKNVCATKKGDYVLTYEHSGHLMLESGVAESVELNNYQDAHLSDGREGGIVTGLTTWGRIRRSYELSFSDGKEEEGRSCSLPNLSGQQHLSGGGEGMLSACDHAIPIYNLAQSMSESSHYQSCSPEERSERLSLLKVYRNKLSVMDGKNLVIPSESGRMNDSSGYITGGNGAAPETEHDSGKKERRSKKQPETDNQSPEFRPQQVPVSDYEYAEFFVNGRYIDVNHNEIGFVPASTQGLQRTTSSVQEAADIPKNQRAQFALNNSVEGEAHNRWTTLTSPRLTKVAPAKPPRTFATLLETSISKANNNDDSESETDGPLLSPRQNSTGSRLRNSGTQVPMYVVDQSVQTACWDSGKLVTTVVTTSLRQANNDKPIYTGRVRALTSPTMSGSCSRVQFDGDMPDLSFLKMPFEVPSLFPSCMPFPLAFLTGSPDLSAPNLEGKKAEEEGGLLSHQPISTLPVSAGNQATITGTKTDFVKFPLAAPFSDNFLLGCTLAETEGKMGLPNPPSKRLLSETSLSNLEAHKDGGVTRDRDSGLGSSGPSHIQDWESLAALLPKDVVEACSFFKANSQLLSRSQQVTSRDSGSGNSIDKPRSSGRCGRRLQSRCQRNRPMSEPGCQRYHARMRKFESIREEDYEDYVEACRSQREQTTSAASLGCYHQHWNCPVVEQREARCRQCRSCPSESSRNLHYHHFHHHYHHCCHRRCASSDTPSTNLKKWHVCRLNCRNCQDWAEGTESESDDSEIEMWQHGKDMRKLRGRLSEGSSTEDEDECLGDSYFLPGAMTSEYHLRRERDRKSEPRRFLSLQNVRDYQRQRGSFLGEESGRPRISTNTHTQCSTACATCFRVRSPTSSRPPFWAIAAEEGTREVFCDCQTSDILEELEADKKRRSSGRTLVNFFGGFPSAELQDEEIALQNTALYKCKKGMVKDVVDACDIVVSVYSAARKSTGFKVETFATAVSDVVRNSLCPAVERILADGLLKKYTIWNVIQASATLGPATRSIHELVSDLNSTPGSNTGEHSLQFGAFLNGLLNLRSLDCWLSYLVLKDKVLSDHYEDAAFLRRATTAYRSLFTKILIGIQPLSLLHFPPLPDVKPRIKKLSETWRKTPRSSSVPAVTSRVSLEPELNVSFRTPSEVEKKEYRLLPTRLPSDSRVPKSSSVPSRLSSPSGTPKSRSVDSGLVRLSGRSQSKIPVLMKASPSFPGANRKPVLPSPSVMSISDQEDEPEDPHFSANKRMVSVVEESCGDGMRGFLSCRAGERLELIQKCVVPGQQLLKCRKRVVGGWEEGFVQRRKISLLT